MEQNRNIIHAGLALIAAAVLIFGILLFANLSGFGRAMLSVGLITDVLALVFLAGCTAHTRVIAAIHSGNAAKAEFQPRLTALSAFISKSETRIAEINSAISLRPGCLTGPSIHALSSARRILEELEAKLESLLKVLALGTEQAVEAASLEYERPLHFPLNKIQAVNDRQIPDLSPGQWEDVMESLLHCVEINIADTKRAAGDIASSPTPGYRER